jgi:CRP-like cAMP-binding protein
MNTYNVLRNRAFELSDDERALLESAVSQTQDFPAGRVVVRQGVPDGKRHLVAVHVPGDFVDLHAYALKTLDHDVAALTDIRVAIFSHASLERIQNSDSRLTRRLWFLTLLDAAMHRQWIYRLASLNAIARVAHFLCEMNARLLAIGVSDGNSFPLPMTQAEIGEVCGLTNVHVNRVLRELREAGVCHMRSSRLDITDLKKLVSIAAFDPAYLYLSDHLSVRIKGPTGAADE